MKTILVATDFSTASRHAFLYAIELSNAFNARLILFSAYQQVPVPVDEPALIMAAEDMGKITRQLLDEEARHSPYSETEIAIDTRCKEGLAYSSILATAKEQKADLIILGMKSAGKGFKKIFGSTVTALAKKTGVPLIIVSINAFIYRIEDSNHSFQFLRMRRPFMHISEAVIKYAHDIDF